jgi:hypothetical protein
VFTIAKGIGKFIPMNKKQNYKDLPLEKLHQLLFERDEQIRQMQSAEKETEKELAELSARKAYLDEINKK